MTGDDRGRIRTLVRSGDLRRALEAVEGLVEEVFTEPLNTAEIYADAFLDEACQAIGAAALQRRPGEPVSRAAGGVVFIASRLQSSGGHTAVLADIARLGTAPTILLTGVGGATDVESLSRLFAGIEGLRLERSPRGDRLARLAWLQSRLAALRPATVWLFNHHQDSVAVAAVQPGQGYALKFLHHGDHHLCLGVTLAWAEHYDPHPMGFRNCRDVLGRTDNRYLPMAVRDPGPRVATADADPAPLRTCTAAGRNKIEHPYAPGYAEVIAQVLAATGGTHLHIGRLTPGYRRRIRRELARRGVAAAAFRYVPRVASVAATLIEERVDLYLGSFPYPAARTLVEVMAAAVPVAAHDHSGSGFLAAKDMLPPGSGFWSQPDELLAFISANDRASLRELGRTARVHYERFHSPERMRAALEGDADAQYVPSSPFVHRPDPLANALRRARGVSLGAFVRRWMLRTARRLKSAVS